MTSFLPFASNTFSAFRIVFKVFLPDLICFFLHSENLNKLGKYTLHLQTKLSDGDASTNEWAGRQLPHYTLNFTIKGNSRNHFLCILNVACAILFFFVCCCFVFPHCGIYLEQIISRTSKRPCIFFCFHSYRKQCSSLYSGCCSLSCSGGSTLCGTFAIHGCI